MSGGLAEGAGGRKRTDTSLLDTSYRSWYKYLNAKEIRRSCNQLPKAVKCSHGLTPPPSNTQTVSPSMHPTLNNLQLKPSNTHSVKHPTVNYSTRNESSKEEYRCHRKIVRDRSSQRRSRERRTEQEKRNRAIGIR